MGRILCDCKMVGPVQTNCYFVWEEGKKDCIIVDPGDDVQTLINFMSEKTITPKAILLTHGHFDHISAVSEIKQKFSIPVYASEKEKEVLADTNINLSSQMSNSVSIEADKWLKDGEEIELIGQKIRCILTPGHTCGGMCYYFPGAGILFSGDTLFQESVGRTDFPTGSMSEIIRSIREKLFILPPAVKVYPGHGLTTSIENEKMFNPFAVE